jgi:hypothetical protein
VFDAIDKSMKELKILDKTRDLLDKCANCAMKSKSLNFPVTRGLI